MVLGNDLGAFSERKPWGFPNGGTTNHRIGVYFTDAWKLKPNFTLTLGSGMTTTARSADSDLERTPKLAQFSPVLGGFIRMMSTTLLPGRFCLGP